ncbi:hypothetical protein GTP91_08370 [Rugamonas sp. FT82W]|uniref:Uncharacterized protein n=1 Tax=Duganella vulcania TaxID=2692166 RepID=A0A845G2H1_9BURK|nr:hypothetical protein [Duganella vulcania]MYM87197.1 hypothetical protein [Duganella vulcania]
MTLILMSRGDMKRYWYTMAVGLGCMAGAQAAPLARLGLPLPLASGDFSPQHIGFSSDNKQLCLTGTNSDPDGRSTAQLLLIDRASNTVSWQKKVPVPDGYSDISPVQCALDAGGVYLLANVNTRSVRSLRQTLAYIYRFDLQGTQTGHKMLNLPGRDHFGAAVAVAHGGVKVAGYLKDEDEDSEYYSMFAVRLDSALAAEPPSIKKTGAFAPFPAARMVGDHLFVAGNFYAQKISKAEGGGDYAISKLRLNGAYQWSLRPPTPDPLVIFTGIASSGAIARLGYHKQTSSLLLVTSEGKAMPEISFASKYCETSELAAFGAAYLAIRRPCDVIRGRAVLVSISPEERTEQLLDWFADEPVYLATDSASWAVVAKKRAGQMFLHSSPASTPALPGGGRAD